MVKGKRNGLTFTECSVKICRILLLSPPYWKRSYHNATQSECAHRLDLTQFAERFAVGQFLSKKSLAIKFPERSIWERELGKGKTVRYGYTVVANMVLLQKYRPLHLTFLTNLLSLPMHENNWLCLRIFPSRIICRKTASSYLNEFYK